MKDFVDYCKKLIKDSNTTVREISIKGNLDRTTIQKMVNGKLFPSYALAHAFLGQLKISEAEKKRFMERFEKAKDGELAYKSRRRILRMLTGIGAENVWKYRMEELESDYTADTENQVMNLVYSGIIENLHSGDISVKLNIPSDAENFFEGLLYLEKQHSGRISIMQQLMISKSDTKEYNTTISFLNQMLKASYQMAERYQVRYTYVNGTEEDYRALLYPYFVLFEDRVIFISADMQNGYVEMNQSVAEQAMKRFMDNWNISFEVMQQSCSYEQVFRTSAETLYQMRPSTHVFENSLCLALIYHSQSFAEQFRYVEDEYKKLYQLAAPTYENQTLINGKYFFTEFGVNQFWDEGIIYGDILKFLPRFTPEQRTKMLDVCRMHAERSDISLHLLNKEIKIPIPISIEVHGKNGVGIIFRGNEDTQINCIVIEETSLCEAFYDFMEHLEALQMALSKEESFAWLAQYK